MKSRIFVGDDIQALSDGKIAALGLYPDDTVQIQLNAGVDPASRIVLSRLCILVAISGLPVGEHAIKPYLIYPDGRAAPGIAERKVKQIANGSVNVICKLEPLVIPEFGEYKFEVRVGKHKFVHSFSLVKVEPPAGKKLARKTVGRKRDAKA